MADCPQPQCHHFGGHVAGCYGPKDPRHTGVPLPVVGQTIEVETALMWQGMAAEVAPWKCPRGCPV